jgi:4-amino-4-deoxy-L-arabinose transferase-like glycosyltransferase
VLWRAYRSKGWRGWLLPLVLLATAGVQAYILRDYPDWSRWLTPLVVGACVVAALVLVVARLRPRRMTWVTVTAASIAVASLLAAPTTWAAYSVANGTNATIPTAGPSAQTTAGFGGGRGGFGGAGGPGNLPGSSTGASRPSGAPPAGAPAFGGNTSGAPKGSTASSARPAGAGSRGAPGGGLGGNQVDTALVRYLEAHQGTALYLVATASSQNASSIIIATGKPVMALGGFSGNDAILTTAQLAQLVASGKVHYFLIQSGGMGGNGSNSALMQWVQTHGTVVPTSQYEASSTATTNGGGQGTALYYVSSSAAGK